MKKLASLAYAGIGHVLIMEVVNLKNKFQRIGVLFCACLMVFVGVFGLFPFFGAAVENVELPIAVLFNPTIPKVFDVTLPIQFNVGLQRFSTISVVDSVWSYDDTVVYDGEQWVNEDYRYIYITSTSVPFDQLLSYLRTVGNTVRIIDYYFPVHPSVFIQLLVMLLFNLMSSFSTVLMRF